MMTEIEYRGLVANRMAVFLGHHSPSEVEFETAIPASSLSRIKRGDYRLQAWQAVRIEQAFPEFGAAWLLGVDGHDQGPRLR